MANEFLAFRVELSAVVQIDGEPVTLEVSEMETGYAINSLPVCNLQLAIGIDVLTGRVANIYNALTKMTSSTPVTVKLKLTPSVDTLRQLNYASVLGIPEGYPEFDIFRGFVGGITFEKMRTANTARMTMLCNHTLSKLGSSTSLSYESHPLNPTQYTYGALMPGSSTGIKDWTIIPSAAEFVNPLNIQTDFWGKCIRPVFEKLLNGNTLRIAELGVQGTALNTSGIAALKSFQVSPTDPVDNNYYTPLGLGVDIDASVASRIAEDLAARVFCPENLAHQSLWDVLIHELAQQYLFAVIPRITDSLVVPYVPTLKQHFLTIEANTYTTLSQSLALSRPVRAVGILSDTISQTGADALPGATADPQQLGLGGWFENGKDGIVLIQQCPRWMTGLLTPTLQAQRTAGAGGAVKSTAMNPTAGKAIDDRAQVNNKAATQIKPLLARYAESVYELEIFKGRQATLSGPLRFDIAPGSSVRVAGTIDGLSAQESSVSMGYQASVLRVGYAIRVDPPAASTVLHLAHIRGLNEVDDLNYSSAEHALWNKATFVGCPMVNFKQ